MTEAFELSRPVRVEELPSHGRTVHVRADDGERAAVADRLGLPAIASIDGVITVRPSLGREIVVEGTIRAEVRQTCVVTGNPLDQALEFSIRRVFADAADIDTRHILDEDEIDPDEDEREPVLDGIIDVGEVVTEELALELPPYPRTPGADFVEVEAAPRDPNAAANEAPARGESGRENPFAALASLKKRLESKE